MPTLLNNGTLFYTLGGGTQQSLTSNTTATTVDVTYGVSLYHSASPTDFAVGDTIAYSTVVQNTGTGSLSDLFVTVDLGGGALDYVAGSAEAFVFSDGVLSAYPFTLAVGAQGLTFTFAQPLPGGALAFINYSTVVNATGGQTVTSNAAVQATSARGTESDTASAVITRREISVIKTAPESAQVGDSIQYTFTVNNTSASPLTFNGLSDQLPANFTFTSLALTVGGVAVPLVEGADYTVTQDGLLTVNPSTEIRIPAGESAVLVINGVVSA